MGQLMSEGAIFLSAGVPDPSAAHFVGDADSVAISSAVSALLQVTLGRRKLVWGGHPSITPMVWAFSESIGVDYSDWVLLYQSRRFEDEFPEENAHFQNVVYTDRVGDDINASLAVMRSRMIEDNRFDAAVFIGGMRGILDEYQLFKEKAPEANVLPIMSTGGAALLLGHEINADAALATNLDYSDLFYAQLAIDPNERRYAKLADQPANLNARLVRPGR